MAERILVRAPNWIGDAVVSLGFLQTLRSSRPGAEVTVMAHRRAAEVFRGHPALGGLIEFGREDSLLSLARQASMRECGECYILPLSFSSALVAWLARVPIRTGYDAELRGPLLTRRLPYDKKAFRSRHLLEGFCRLLGDGAGPEDPKVGLEAGELDRAEEWLRQAGIDAAPAGFGPGATYGPAKMWPAERWIELGKALSGKGRRVLVFGAGEEADLCQGIARGIGPAAVSCAGRTGLRQSAALLSKCGYFVTNDTGVMHLAAAAGTRVAALFGSTNPDWTRPWGKGHAVVYGREPCSPCYQRTCRFGHYNCLSRITVEQVLKAIDNGRQIG